jgi:hypothetical protein
MEIEYRKINKYSGYIGGVITVIILMVMLYSFLNSEKNKISDLYQKKMLFKSIQDVVDSKFEDSRNHSELTLSFKNSSGKLNSIPQSWLDLIEVGDSISKERNQLIFYLFKKDGKTYKLDYQLYLDRMDENGYLD